VECGVTHLPARREVVHAFCAHDKAEEIFGGGPTVGLDEGIARMARWIKAVGVRPPTPFPGDIEVPIGMPPSWAATTAAS
jgi:UDP-glucose 4-epimerase